MKPSFSPLIRAAALASALLFSAAATATDRPDHFEGLPAPDLATAVSNFTEYNALLAARLAGKLDNADLLEIHRLTYTLENALATIHREIGALVDTLEDVHVASETFQRDALQEKGREYMQVIETLKNLGHASAPQ